MFVIIGIFVVLGAVIGGFLMAGGNLHVLFVPAEFIVIFGAAAGAFFIASPPKVISAVFKELPLIISSKGYSKADYLDILSLLYRIFSKIRKEGLISIEADIENPYKSGIFNKHSGVMKNHHAVNFICDNLKVMVSTNVPPHELDSLLDLEIEAHHHESMIPSHSVSKVADGLPGLGIVAAVLGIVITMGKIDQPPAVIGYSVAHALVGTFLGVMMCYGFVGPIAANMEHRSRENTAYLQVIKVALVAFVGGAAPQMAVEFARRAISGECKPSFEDLEKEMKKAK